MTIRSISSLNSVDGVTSGQVPGQVTPVAPVAGVLVEGETFHEGNPEDRAKNRFDRDALERQVDGFNQAAEKANLQLSVSIHEGSHSIVVKLIDEKTKKVVREIPPEKYLDMIENLQKLAGLNVDVRT